MALKTLMIRKRLDEKNTQLEEVRKRIEALLTREAEIEQAIEEAQTEEEKETVEAEIDAYEQEKTDAENEKVKIESEITDLEKELEEGEQRQKTMTPKEERKEQKETMIYKEKFFNMTAQERDAFFEQEEVKAFLATVRNRAETRAAGDITNPQVLIPQVMIPILRQVVEENSKMYKHVNVERINGTARMVVDGGFPEGVWTEMCGNLNELTIGYNDVEVDGYKVGGFIKICNAILEDSDIALATEIIRKLGQGIGYALDKAILYGTGTKMPQGIVTRLAEDKKPTNYPATARTWVDLHTSNIVSIKAADSTGIKLFQEIIKNMGATSNKYGNGNKFFVMNEKTYTTLMVEALSINASGALVTGMNQTMPVIGGSIEVLDFIPDNVIVAGYDNLYLLAERAGTEFAQSEHRYFVEDQTVFKGTARYDGLPVIAEGFIGIGINGAAVTATAVTFASDTANA